MLALPVLPAGTTEKIDENALLPGQVDILHPNESFAYALLSGAHQLELGRGSCR